MRGRKKLVAFLTLVATLVVGGLAFAYWTQGGSGAGSATPGTTSAITVNQTTTVTGLYPGDSPVTLSGTFNNPNVHSVNISSVTASVHAFTAHADLSKPDCTAADFAVGGTSGANVVPTGNNQGSWTGLTVRMLDNGLNQDNCKSVSITIDYTANP